MYGNVRFNLGAFFTKKLYLLNPELHYDLKAFEKKRIKKHGLEEKVTTFTLKAGSAVGAHAFGAELARGAISPLSSSLVYLGNEVRILATSETKRLPGRNYFSAALGTYAGFFIENLGRPAFLLSLKLEEEMRLSKRWGFCIASESTKSFLSEDKRFQFLQKIDLSAKIKTGKPIKAIRFPDKYSFGLRYLFFQGNEAHHTVMLLGTMEL